jgi:hypothetical protein
MALYEGRDVGMRSLKWTVDDEKLGEIPTHVEGVLGMPHAC